MKHSILLLIVGFFINAATAQNKKIGWQGGVQVGLLEGEQGGRPLLAMHGGAKLKTWAASVGTGLDYYDQRSVPVFLRLQKNFGQGKSPFVYAAGGRHFPWLRPQEKIWNIVENTGGFYGDAGVGYQIPVFKKSALQFSVGYSVKERTTKEFEGAVIAIYPMPTPEYTSERNYSFRRLSLKIGLAF